MCVGNFQYTVYQNISEISDTPVRDTCTYRTKIVAKYIRNFRYILQLFIDLFKLGFVSYIYRKFPTFSCFFKFKVNFVRCIL